MTSDDILQKTKQAGYWRVIVRPTVFDPERIPSLTKAWQLAENSVVVLRGWDYPHLDQNERLSGADWIGCQIDWYRHTELWRMYQSGQFVHYFAMWEDVEKPNRAPIPERYLEPVGLVYRLTEVFLFAARLTEAGVLHPQVFVSIRLSGLENRELMYWDFSRVLLRTYRATSPELECTRIFEPAELAADSSGIALGVAEYFFERFGWLPPPMDLFAQDQERLIQRKL